ncbi:MAG: hypothetical protein WC824_11660 [Bacteroidota bacterium]
MEPTKTSNADSSREWRRQQRPMLILIVLVALVAGGLYTWSSFLRSIRYEIEIEPPQLFSGMSDTARISAAGMNRWGSRVPFSHPSILVEVVEGAELGRIVEDKESGTVRFISNGIIEGQVVLRVVVEDWPFPMMVVINFAAPIAAWFSSIAAPVAAWFPNEERSSV